MLILDGAGPRALYFRSSHQRCSLKRGALRNFTKFAGKRLCQSLWINLSRSQACNLLKKRLWRRCFHVSFMKFLVTFFTEHLSTSASVPWETNLPSYPRRLLICLRISNKLYRINRWVNYFLIRRSTTGIFNGHCPVTKQKKSFFYRTLC